MMAASPAIRIASTSGGGKQPAADAPAREADGFPAALTAATTPKPRASGGTARDSQTAAADPALAAALAAMLPVPNPDSTATAEGGDALADGAVDGVAGGLQSGASADELLAGSTDAAGDALDAQLAAMNEDRAADDGRGDLLQQLTRQIALSREAGDPVRSGTTDLRAAAADAPSGSAGSHAATQLSAVTLPASTVITAANAQALQAPLGTPRWAEELGSRLVMMTTQGRNEGSLTLTPEHLGPLEVRISIQQNTANVWFGAQHADTRAALTEAMPRLREMLAESGLSLGHAGVSHEAPREQTAHAGAVAHRSGADGEAALPAESPSPGVRRAVSRLLDLYA